MLKLTSKKVVLQLTFFQLNTPLIFKQKNLKLKKANFLKKTISHCISIKFVSNNIYCTFWSISGQKTIYVRSIGITKINPSKRQLFFYGRIFLESFFKELQQWQKKFKTKNIFYMYSLKVPKKFRKLILKNIFKNAISINFEYSKAFNGCKAKKKRRKKRLGFRSFK